MVCCYIGCTRHCLNLFEVKNFLVKGRVEVRLSAKATDGFISLFSPAVFSFSLSP